MSDGESVAALILRGPRVEINKLVQRVQTESRLRLVFCRVADSGVYFYVKTLDRGKSQNDFEPK
jgi:hypothetical protein